MLIIFKANVKSNILKKMIFIHKQLFENLPFDMFCILLMKIILKSTSFFKNRRTFTEAPRGGASLLYDLSIIWFPESKFPEKYVMSLFIFWFSQLYFPENFPIMQYVT